jgi:citronellyl-CoA dehydrogenase
MKFTPEHRQLEDTVVKFCDKEINPFVAAWRRLSSFPAMNCSRSSAAWACWA